MTETEQHGETWVAFIGNGDDAPHRVHSVNHGPLRMVAIIECGTDADARLIAAAPDLLEFARFVLNAAARIRDGADVDEEVDDIAAQAAELIERATGSQS